MTAREFVAQATGEASPEELVHLTNYVANGPYDHGIDYSAFPDADVSDLAADGEEPAAFQEYLARR